MGKFIKYDFAALINEEFAPRDINESLFHESGNYLDKALSGKDPPMHCTHQDAHRIYAQQMGAIHNDHHARSNKVETIQLHAEDRGDNPYVPPCGSRS